MCWCGASPRRWTVGFARLLRRGAFSDPAIDIAFTPAFRLRRKSYRRREPECPNPAVEGASAPAPELPENRRLSK
jgi:hypothetical protein